MTNEFQKEILETLPKLRAVAIMMTRDRANADDLVQDTLVQAIAAQHSYTIGTNFAGWAYRIMRNRYISLIRRRRFNTVSLDDPAALAAGQPGNQEDHMAQLELVRALKHLPLAQREAVLLVGAMGMSYDEAAAIFGCSIGTVKSRVSRARAALRRGLIGDEPNDGATIEGNSAILGELTDSDVELSDFDEKESGLTAGSPSTQAAV